MVFLSPILEGVAIFVSGVLLWRVKRGRDRIGTARTLKSEVRRIACSYVRVYRDALDGEGVDPRSFIGSIARSPDGPLMTYQREADNLDLFEDDARALTRHYFAIYGQAIETGKKLLQI